MTVTRGVLSIMSAPSPLCPHIEWAIGGIIGAPISLDWRPQPAERGSYRSEYAWSGRPGTAAALASALKRWPRLRFEASEEATAVAEPQRYSYTPSLGVFHAVTSLSGDVLVSEDRIRLAVRAAGSDVARLASELDSLMGVPWDEELDVFRQAGEGEHLRWLHKVG